MKWKEKIDSWMNGEYQKYPNGITESFYYETSPITNDMNTNILKIYI